MKNELTEFLKDKEDFVPINGFLKQYIIVQRKPLARESVADVKDKLKSLVENGDLLIENNGHLVLDQLSGSQEVSPNGLALPIKYYSLDDVSLRAKLP